MNKRIMLGAVAALGLFTAGVACATPVTFFGQDQNPGSSTANADAARASFMSYLASGVGTEDFEGVATGLYSSLPIAFPGSTGSITANLGGDLKVCPSSAGVTSCGYGRFATSGSQYLQSTDSSFTLTFSKPISAFGFYGTDIGDISADLTLTLSLSGGGSQDFTLNTSGSNDGNELFWGFIDPDVTYTAITFGNSQGGSDVFGFDDMTIGDIGQVTGNPTGVPEPGALGMLGLGLLGMISLMLLRRRAAFKA